ncbi:MAG: hypothetical protein QXZ70_07985 [Candidatus Bathyarchaeia archaeon]
MKKTALALTSIFALMFSLFAGANAVQFDYTQFEGLPYTLPIVVVSSPSPNGVYSVSDVPLNVTIQIRSVIYPGNNERLRWLNYSLDGQVPIPASLIVPSDLTPPYYVHGNGVLTSLSDGNHTLVVFGETFVGGLNGYFNETVSFTVDKSIIPEPDSLPTSIAIASVVTVAVAGIGLLVYFKKRKSKGEA